MKIAAFTMVYNEPIMLPLWAQHYGRQFGPENLFLLDHGSDDGSTAGVVANTIRLPRGSFDEAKRSACVSSFHAALLAHYDAVVFTDCDEFLVADPAAFPGLAAFIAARCTRFVTAFGFNVVQMPDGEPPIDWHRPVLEQRSFAQFERPYCKSLISRVPLRWGPGFHGCGEPPRHDRDLYLFHLKFVDTDTFRTAQRKRQAVQWSAESLAAEHGQHWRRSPESFAVGRLRRSGNPSDAPPLDDPNLAEVEAVQQKSRGPGRLYAIPERFRAAIPGIAPD